MVKKNKIWAKDAFNKLVEGASRRQNKKRAKKMLYNFIRSRFSLIVFLQRQTKISLKKMGVGQKEGEEEENEEEEGKEEEFLTFW